ncbi:unnamed protein product [Spirodela intermedia]|uniref:BHLH domain-containing protein n=1 Tax=Spirodela intermedia TaxID=51605 RepID=A0A7I8L291_SPIIN|nr:unnamed protein product [Spirodela intermedia]
MGSDGGEDYSWIDDVGGGLEEDFRAAIEEVCGNAGGPDQMDSKKRARSESIVETKTKACREKMRRDRLNDRFVELGSVLDPERAHRQSDKASILSDAARVLGELRNEAQKLKEANEKLQEAIRELKAEKTELRDEKTRLKADKEELEQQVKAMSLPPTGFLPHPAAFHAAGAGKAQAFPGLAMWHWLPPASVDTTQDAKLWPPNA